MVTTREKTVSIIGVLTESRTILRASSGRFNALPLFFLPLSYALVTTPMFILDHLQKYSPNDYKDLYYLLLFVLLVYVLTLCATASITYSVYHGKPFTFFTEHRSLNFSFFPIISTVIIAHVVQFMLLLVYLVFFVYIFMLLQGLGFVTDYNWLTSVVWPVFIVNMIGFHVDWLLALVVVVVESKWGSDALARSSHLMERMTLASIELILLYGIITGIMSWVFSRWDLSYSIVFHSNLLMLFLHQIIVANTVFHNHCKVFHGEVTIGVSEGSGNDYISLPDDDENVDPHVVTVVTA